VRRKHKQASGYVKRAEAATAKEVTEVELAKGEREMEEQKAIHASLWRLIGTGGVNDRAYLRITDADMQTRAAKLVAYELQRVQVRRKDRDDKADQERIANGLAPKLKRNKPKMAGVKKVSMNEDEGGGTGSNKPAEGGEAASNEWVFMECNGCIVAAGCILAREEGVSEVIVHAVTDGDELPSMFPCNGQETFVGIRSKLYAAAEDSTLTLHVPDDSLRRVEFSVRACTLSLSRSICRSLGNILSLLGHS
jgi:hypothetical protein